MRLCMTASILVGLLVVCTAQCGDPEYVRFVDDALRQAVCEALGVWDPTPEDMLQFPDQTLVAIEKGITDLTGLEYAENLDYLEVWRNSISDLRPLAGLTKLRHLDVAQNQVTDLSPVAGLTHLQYLNVHGNPTGDLTALAGLPNLKTLIARQMQISDLSPLSALCSLEYLELFQNRISSLSPLTALSGLTFLSFGLNQVSDLEPLRGLTNLEHLSANQNLVTDLGPLCSPDMDKLTYLNLMGNYLSDDACQNQVPVILARNPGLLLLGPCSANADPKVVLSVIIVDDSGPNDPGPGDSRVSDPQEDGTAGHPFDSIQEAIEVAGHGASVVVRPGVYRETIDLQGRRIRVTGLDPADPCSPYPVIDGNGIGPVVRLESGEDPNCILEGLVITGGRGGAAGAVSCVQGSPTIAHCLIVGNAATEPQGAIILCRASGATFSHCTIAGNHPGRDGAALSLTNSPVTVTHSIVWGNGSQEVLLHDAVRPALSYTDIAGGWDGPGNRAADPLFARLGHWADPADPDVVWEAADPQALRIEGDYHLQSQAGRWDPQTRTWVLDPVSSPCIDAGDPARSVGYEPAPHGGVINLGAYGGTAQASQSILDPIQSGDHPWADGAG